MAKRKNNVFIAIICALLIIALAVVAVKRDAIFGSGGSSPKEASAADLTAYFLNVGQADCIFITVPKIGNIIIDAGNNADGDNICDFIKDMGVSRIDYVIATHPHEDHIGGMDDVIDNFDIGKVYTPDTMSDTKSTDTYKDFMSSLEAKSISPVHPSSGDKIINRPGCSLQVLSPEKSEDYDDMNEYSITLELTYGSEKMLFMGDASKENEKEIMNDGYNIDCDLIKIGHHGSSDATGAKFLDAVTPEYAVIMCETGNSYNHPHKETLKEISERDYIKLYRTDINGTVIAECDGKKISITTDDWAA